MINRVLAGAIGAGIIFAAGPALAGEWRLNDRSCQEYYQNRDNGRWDERRIDDNDYDRRSDRRVDDNDRDGRIVDIQIRAGGQADRRDDRGDRRYNRRGETITICPIGAFYYAPNKSELRRGHYEKIDHRDDGYARSRRDARPSLQYDSRKRLSYRYVDGRKVYVRAETSSRRDRN